MRAAFLGTSEFAAVVLRRLAAGPHRPVIVVAPPDRPRGRGRRPGSPPVAEAARELGIELRQTADINAPEARAALAAAAVDIAAVCAFGQIVGEPLLSSLEALNVHPSLLPRWRGAAPIERAIMAGDAVTGVCVIRLTAELDAGPVASRCEEPIAGDDDYGALAGRLAAAGGELLEAALGDRATGRLQLEEQAAEGVTYAARIEPAERRIDPRAGADAEARRIRALTPHIGAFALLADGSRLGLRSPAVVAGGPAPGVFEVDDGGLVLGCAPGAIRLGEVQPEGGRWMACADYLRGHGLPAPTVAVDD